MPIGGFGTTIRTMPKTAVCSWRIDPKLKRALQAEARLEGITLPELLNRMICQSLENSRRTRDNDEAEQRRLHAAVAKSIGAISDVDDPYFSENVSVKMRKILTERHERGRL